MEKEKVLKNKYVEDVQQNIYSRSFLKIKDLYQIFISSFSDIQLAVALEFSIGKLLKSLVLFLFIMGSTLNVVGAISNEFSIGGRLTNNVGEALEGTYDITFRIYDAASGGNMLWQSNKVIITDSSGFYSVILDSIDLLFDQGYYLGISVMSDPEMTPRIKLTSLPYSFRSGISENIVCDDCIDGETLSDSIILDERLDISGKDFSIGTDNLFVKQSSGNVGIGVNSPSDKLTVNGSIRLIPISVSICDSIHKGSIYFDSDDNFIYLCNGGEWILFGNQGDIGPAGPAGPQGPKGEQGDKGSDGMQGPQGQIGPKGDQGDIGPAGSQGQVGDKGDHGDPGLTGPEGPMGPMGITGPAGIKGDTGSSCTVIDNLDKTYTINCEDGSSILLSDGQNGESGTSSWIDGDGIVTTEGNVGIGTTTPTQKLTVVGDVNATNSFYAGNIKMEDNEITTTTGNVTITSVGGSVIIRLG